MTRGARQFSVATAVAAMLLGACAPHPVVSTFSTLPLPLPVAATAPVGTASTIAPAPGPVATTGAPATALSTSRPPAALPRAAPAPATTRVTQPPCPVNLAGQLASTEGAAQLVTVDASSEAATTATVMLWQRSGACWVPAGGPWAAHLGRRGLSNHHREGDGTTPTGSYTIGPVSYGIAANPGVHGSYHQLVCGDWWDEDPASPRYNTFQHVACGANPPFSGGSEALWTETTASRRFAVVEYNTSPVVPGAGSAIFIHDDDGGTTNGCISLAPAQIDSLLLWLQPEQAPRVIIGADADIRRL